jgi:copper(I)-binding protein
MRKTTIAVVCILAVAFCTASAWAVTTPPADTLKVDYFANANTAGAPDGTVRIDNPGTSGGGLCAAIFVFDVNQEMSECCSCYVSPDGLRTLSVNTDLTSNPLTGVVLNTGVIKIVSTFAYPNKSCPTPTNPTLLVPTPAVRAWATHIQNSNFTVTETNSQDATLSATEQADLQTQCRSIHSVGSGAGICSCGTGD